MLGFRCAVLGVEGYWGLCRYTAQMGRDGSEMDVGAHRVMQEKLVGMIGVGGVARNSGIRGMGAAMKVGPVLT